MYKSLGQRDFVHQVPGVPVVPVNILEPVVPVNMLEPVIMLEPVNILEPVIIFVPVDVWNW